MHIRDLEKDDLTVLTASGIDTRTFLRPHHRVHLAMNPDIVGLVFWRATPLPQPAYLKRVLVTSHAPENTLHRLVLHAAIAAQSEGYTHAIFDVASRALLDRLIRQYGIMPMPNGVDPETRKPLSWTHIIELKDALGILERLLPASPS